MFFPGVYCSYCKFSWLPDAIMMRVLYKYTRQQIKDPNSNTVLSHLLQDNWNRSETVDINFCRLNWHQPISIPLLLPSIPVTQVLQLPRHHPPQTMTTIKFPEFKNRMGWGNSLSLIASLLEWKISFLTYMKAVCFSYFKKTNNLKQCFLISAPKTKPSSH